ncbi:flagellar basal body rod protein FlgC [Paraherbaspirillum soli]|uniref:Flagellar basal-body rod protein FlgC n=1 Tax=Paraherbaspirillum soli TaxID=631222 RepID=A0ABW0MDI3_9BURK
MTQIFEISRSAMDVEWRRMEVIAQNMANANTTRTPLGEPYQPLRLVSGPSMTGASSATATTSTFSGMLKQQTAALDPLALKGVQVYGVERMTTAPRLVYEPSHPHADAKGFVAYPGIDHAGEMALMVKTSRVYEANVVAFNAARSMYMRALDLGGKG